VPADRKWYTRLLVADMISQRLEGLGLKYPTVSKEHLAFLQEARQQLEAEGV
jgi:hypothetical protein